MDKKFVTVVTCMDGRIQLAINKFMQEKYSALYVDTITEAGPCKVISNNKNIRIIENVKARLDISINSHFSKAIGVVGHFDCAAVLESDLTQKQYVITAAKTIRSWYPKIDVIALWVNEDIEVEELK